MSYALTVLPRAEADFRVMYRYIQERSPDGAQRWREAFEKGLARLRQNALACGYAPENEESDREVRQLFFRTTSGRRYRVVYFVDNDQVFILRVRGPGQPPLASDELAFD